QGSLILCHPFEQRLYPRSRFVRREPRIRGQQRAAHDALVQTQVIGEALIALAGTSLPLGVSVEDEVDRIERVHALADMLFPFFDEERHALEAADHVVLELRQVEVGAGLRLPEATEAAFQAAFGEGDLFTGSALLDEVDDREGLSLPAEAFFDRERLDRELA